MHKVKSISLTEKFEIKTFEHIDDVIQGVNGQPFINMDYLFDLYQFEDLHKEVLLGLALSEQRDEPVVGGVLPPAYKQAYVDRTFEMDNLYKLALDINNNEDRERIRLMNRVQLRRYAWFSLNSIPPWYFTLYLRRGDFLTKQVQNKEFPLWEKSAIHFPKLVEFIKTLPFKTIGRVMFFVSYPGVSVPPHRDGVVSRHRDHCINFFFGHSRPSYIYDSLNDIKHYLDDNCRSYFFNNRDYHGVDSTQRFEYTLRVDGTFTDELQNELKLIDGFVT